VDGQTDGWTDKQRGSPPDLKDRQMADWLKRQMLDKQTDAGYTDAG